MGSIKRVIAGALMGLLVAGPITAAHAGWFDWLKRKPKTETEYKGPSKLDSSTKWDCSIGGGCAGGKGLCCVDGLESHFNGTKGIEKVEVDREKGAVSLTIKKGETVDVKELQKSLGGHWKIKSIQKSEI